MDDEILTPSAWRAINDDVRRLKRTTRLLLTSLSFLLASQLATVVGLTVEVFRG